MNATCKSVLDAGNLSEVLSIFRCADHEVERVEDIIILIYICAESSLAVSGSSHVYDHIHRLVVPSGKVSAVVRPLACDAVCEHIRAAETIAWVSLGEHLNWTAHSFVPRECLCVESAAFAFADSLESAAFADFQRLSVERGVGSRRAAVKGVSYGSRALCMKNDFHAALLTVYADLSLRIKKVLSVVVSQDIVDCTELVCIVVESLP